MRALERARRRSSSTAPARGAPPAARERRHLQRLRRPAAGERLWPLDPIPLLLTSARVEAIEQGLIQRAELLELVLADLYGPHTLIRRGLAPAGARSTRIPASRGRASAFVRRADAQLPLYAADLARRPDGSVLRRSAIAPRRRPAPATRSRTASCCRACCRASSATRTCTACRCSSAACARRSARWRRAAEDNPHIVLLTPGPGNETYFEHAFLASYLGCTLAQGDDLTVRDQRVWLRTLDGLRAGRRHPAPRRRRVLRSARAARRLAARHARPAAGGAPRHGRDRQPARHQRRREPGLDAVPAARSRASCSARISRCRRCRRGGAAIRQRARVRARAPRPAGHQADLPAPSPRHACSAAALDAPRRDARSRADRARSRTSSSARSSVPLSTAPALIDGRLEPRADGAARLPRRRRATATRSCPAGSCRVAPTRDSSVVSNQRGGVSKDVWVLASEPEREVEPARSGRPAAAAAARRPRGAGPRRRRSVLARPLRRARRGAARACCARCCAACSISTRAPYDAHLPALLRAVDAADRHLSRLSSARAPPSAWRRRKPSCARAPRPRAASAACASTSTRWRAPARAVRDRLSTDTWRVIGALDREFAGRHDSTPRSSASTASCCCSPPSAASAPTA